MVITAIGQRMMVISTKSREGFWHHPNLKTLSHDEHDFK
jgi:hypothetical protein